MKNRAKLVKENLYDFNWMQKFEDEITYFLDYNGEDKSHYMKLLRKTNLSPQNAIMMFSYASDNFADVINEFTAHGLRKRRDFWILEDQWGEQVIFFNKSFINKRKSN